MEQILDDWPAQLTVLTATAYAMVLGGVIGFEREMKDRPAGFRTHMLVAGAAALLVGLADLLAVRYSGEHYRELVRVDPLRLIEAVVAPVGFPGARAIFPSGDDRVTGITTSDSLLLFAGIGLAGAVVHPRLTMNGAGVGKG